MLKRSLVPLVLLGICSVILIGCAPVSTPTAENRSDSRASADTLPGGPTADSGGRQSNESNARQADARQAAASSGGLPGNPTASGSGGGGNADSGNAGAGNAAAAVSPGGGSDGLPVAPSAAGSAGGGNTGSPNEQPATGSGAGGTSAFATLPDGPSSAGGGGNNNNSGGGGTSASVSLDPGGQDNTGSNPPAGGAAPGGPPPGAGGAQGGFPLPPGYGGSGGPPAGSGGPPEGYNNPRPGQGGNPGQSGPPAGYNDPRPGQGGQQLGGGQGPTSSGSGGDSNAGNSGSSAAVSLDGGGNPAANSGGGSAGGASMSLDGGGGPPGISGAFGYGQRAPEAPAVVEEKSFYDMALNAFARGHDADGYRYLQAEFAVNKARFEETPLNFWTQQKNTTIGVRIGVGVQYIAAEGVSGKVPVIGDPAPTLNRNNNPYGGPGSGALGGPSGFGGPGGDGPPKDAKGTLSYYGGDLANVLLEKLDERFNQRPGVFGSIWPEIGVRVLMDEKQMSDHVSSRPSGAGDSSLPAGGPSGLGGYGGGQSNSGPAEGLFAGLVFLGEGTFADLLKRGKKEGLDGLFVLDQRGTKARRTGQIGSQTTVMFYTCDDGKEKASTSGMNYAMVAQQRVGLKDSTKDPVEKELTSLFTKVDRLLGTTPMPELTEEQVKGRLDSIVESSKDDPLPFVNETNYYLQKGLLNDDDAQAYIIQSLGEDAALDLWSNDFEKQKTALKRWLPNRS